VNGQYFLSNIWLVGAGLWLAITTTLGIFSGWFLLMWKYPDRKEETALLQLKRQSGSMGLGVAMQSILNISVCPSGLRVGIMRIFGPFCRNVLVPWEVITVERKNWWFSRVATLRFGNPVVGRLSIPAHLADRLARAALAQWPEPGPFPRETNQQVLVSVAKEWAGLTILVALFFTVVPRLMAPKDASLPLSFSVLLPAVAFGIAALFEYFNRTRV